MAYVELVSAEEVMDEMGLNQDLMDAAIPSFKGAIQRATVMIQSMLDSSLVRKTGYDLFYLDPLTCGEPLAGLFRLRLSSGFLSANAVVSVADTLQSGFTPLSLITVDKGKGWVSVAEKSTVRDTLVGKYIKVAYSCGFADKTTLPMDVRHALICHVPLLTLSTGSTEPDQVSARESKGKALLKVAEDLVQSRSRVWGASIKPIFTTLAAL